MDLGQKGVFCFTDALSPTQLIELAQTHRRTWLRRVVVSRGQAAKPTSTLVMRLQQSRVSIPWRSYTVGVFSWG